MKFRPIHLIARPAHLLAGALALTLLVPTVAAAQVNRPKGPDTPAMGENYRVEMAYAWWKPDVGGAVTSDRLDVIGSRVDLVNDLGFGAARFKDVRITVKPGRKHKLRFQYTPLAYNAEGVLTRDITYAGKTFAASLPIASTLGWKVWRIGYEWDVIYKPRGFVGVLFEARKTELSAALQSLLAEGSFVAQAPLPAIGVVARAYPLPDLAINFEMSGLKIPAIDEKYEGNYTDLELSGTVNITNNLGVSVGWRRLNTSLRVEQDFGELKFKGLWFGGAVRF